MAATAGPQGTTSGVVAKVVLWPPRLAGPMMGGVKLPETAEAHYSMSRP